MADVKWIKITTDMFDNKKIKYLRRLPDGNSIVLIWVMLLTMAGKCNANGMIFLTENIPYTTKMLADELDFEENTVILALEALERLNMVITNGDMLSIARWGDHQNIDGMERIREQNRKRAAAHRAKQKALAENGNVTCNVTVTECNAIERDKEREIDKERDIKRESNSKLLNSEEPSQAEQKKKSAPSLYGIYQNVFLSDSEYITLQEEFPLDYDKQIDKLSTYMKGTGKSYDSHFAMIRKWAMEDKAKSKSTNNGSFRGSQVVDNFDDIYEVGGPDQEPKQLPTEEEVEAFRKKIETEYADYLPEQRESFVESFRKGNWKK